MLIKYHARRIASLSLVVMGIVVVIVGLFAMTTIVSAGPSGPKYEISKTTIVSAKLSGPKYEISKTISYAEGDGAFIGDRFTVTLVFQNLSPPTGVVSVVDENPDPVHLRILSDTLTGGAIYSPTFRLVPPPATDAVVWTGDLEPTSPVTITFQMLVIGGSGLQIENYAFLEDADRQPYEPVDADDTEVIRIFARIYLPVVLRTFRPLPVVNGGFETGNTIGWQVSGDTVLPAPQVVDTDPISGSYHLLLGDPTYCNTPDPAQPGDHASTAAQHIYVPDVPGTPMLKFWYRVFTYDHLTWTSGKLGDSLDVYVKDELALQDNYENYPDPSPKCETLLDSDWRAENDPWGGIVDQDVLDLSEWKGQLVEVRFELWTRWDGYYNTWAYLDDVQVEIVP